MAQTAIIAGGSSNLGAKLLTCLLLVGTADFLFFNHQIGWTLGLFALLILAIAVIGNPVLVTNRHGVVLALLAAGMGLALIETDNILAFILYGLFFAALLSDVRITDKLSSYLRKHIALAGHMAGFAAYQDAYACRHHRRRIKAARPLDWVMGLMRIWLLPLGLTALFLLLFASANPVIENWLIQFERWLLLMEPQAISGLPAPERILFWIVCATAFWGVLRSNKLRFRDKPEKAPMAMPAASDISSFLFSRQAVIRTLAIANLLFLLQNGLDANFLWGEAALPEGFTYAQYAHRGAYALMVTALLAAAFVLIALRENSETANDGLTRGLIYLWLLQTMVLVAAAMWRTNFYIAEYSLTYLRLSALLWMGLILFGLLLILIKMLMEKSAGWLVRANIVATLTLLYAICFVDMGRYIASYNIAQVHPLPAEGTSPMIDLEYLRNIGPSALPALQRWRLEFEANEKIIPVELMVLSQRLKEDLALSVQDWRGWTFRNYRLWQELYERPVQQAGLLHQNH